MSAGLNKNFVILNVIQDPSRRVCDDFFMNGWMLNQVQHDNPLCAA